MQPLAIVYAANVSDIQKAVAYAAAEGIALAVRTGGHQYSGASSTSGNNLQLDLSETFRDFKWDPATGLVEVGVSYSLLEFNAKLGQTLADVGNPLRGFLSVPHGQCSHVHLGGHAQTGGYGSFTRAFGLFADHIEAFKIVDDKGVHRTVARNTGVPEDQDLFFAVLGGSPGNFGVLTHLIIKPMIDGDYSGSRGMKRMTLYSRKHLQALLELMVDFANDDKMPAGFDFSVTMMSSASRALERLWPGLDVQIKQNFPQLFGHDAIPLWPPFIIVYAQWSDLPEERGQYDPDWFARIKQAMGPSLPTVVGELDAPFTSSFEGPMSLSRLAEAWIYKNVREFDRPYVKRAYSTNSTTLKKKKWSSWVAGRIHEIEASLLNGCKLATQFFYWGGSKSKLVTQDDGKTAYSWRKDTKICQILDCFYGQPTIFGNPLDNAQEWQDQNDSEGLGPNGFLCDKDRRYLWGSFGHKKLDDVWDRYFETKAKYDRLVKIKKAADPKNIFSPNEFCVGYAAPGKKAPLLIPELEERHLIAGADFDRKMSDQMSGVRA